MIKSRFMDTVGDGTGTIAGNVNGSVTPVILRIKPGASEILYASRIIISIFDTLMDSSGYGGIGALTNGVQLLYKRYVGEAGEATLIDLTANLPIKSNTHWKALCHDEIFSNYGTGFEGLSYRYTFTNDTDGDPIILSGQNKEELQIVISDDLTGLTGHYFRVGMKN